MTKRVLQHQLEDISRTQLCLALPREWVFRDKAKDYGIDAEIELFDKFGNATGLMFFVQLKATERKQESSENSCVIKIDRIKYYKRLLLPVLIVHYSEETKTLYAKWAHEIDLFFCKDKAKYITVKFSRENICIGNYWLGIEKQVKKIFKVKRGQLSIPAKFTLTFRDSKIRGITSAIFKKKILIELSNYKHIIEHSDDENESLVSVQISKDRVNVSLAGLMNVTIHSVEKIDIDKLFAELALNVVVNYAYTLFMIGQLEACASILTNELLLRKISSKREMLTHVLPALVRTSQISKLLVVVNSIIDDSEDENILESISVLSIILSQHTDEYSDEIIKIEQKLIGKYLEKDLEIVSSTCCYNLGMHFRFINQVIKAYMMYKLAGKLNDAYLKQSYYNFEIAGILFDMGRYSMSMKYYGIGMAIGEENRYKPLLADSMMMCGEYKKAFQIFVDFNKSINYAEPQWYLKECLLREIVEEYSVEIQSRKPLLADSYVGKKLFDEALSNDYLCSEAWFNKGLHKTNKELGIKGTSELLNAAIISPQNISYALHAIVFVLTDVQYQPIFTTLYQHCEFYHKDNLLTDLYEMLSQSVPKDLLDDLIEYIEENSPKSNNSDSKPTVRFWGKDNTVTIINKP